MFSFNILNQNYAREGKRGSEQKEKKADFGETEPVKNSRVVFSIWLDLWISEPWMEGSKRDRGRKGEREQDSKRMTK